MYKDGSIVTLSIDKTHCEAGETTKLKIGTCGLIMQTKTRNDGNHQYIVDFGPYGQWYCNHDELSEGDTKEKSELSDASLKCTPLINFFYDKYESESKNPITIDFESDSKQRQKEIEEGL